MYNNCKLIGAFSIQFDLVNKNIKLEKTVLFQIKLNNEFINNNSNIKIVFIFIINY